MDEFIHITKTSFRVADFLAWQRHNALDLRPPFQRGSVWSRKARSLFIDSIIRGFPIPLVFLKDETDATTFEPKRLVVDGQQRIRTVLAFIDASVLADAEEEDHFTVARSHNPDPKIFGQPFAKLPEQIRQRILDFEFSVHVLPPATPNRLLLDMFARLNSTGTQLNEQEVRNAQYAGEYKQVVYSLAYDQLERWLDWKVFSRAQIARMKEVELTSELTMLITGGVRGKSQAAIDQEYRSFDDEFPQAERVQVRMNTTFDFVEAMYPDSLAESPFRTQAWFYALFAYVYGQLYPKALRETSSDGPKKLSAAGIRAELDERAARLAAGSIDGDLLKALRGAAADRSSRLARLSFLKGGA